MCQVKGQENKYWKKNNAEWVNVNSISFMYKPSDFKSYIISIISTPNLL